MKKSAAYYYAMLAVMDSSMKSEEKIDILEMLNENRRTAEWCERQADMREAEGEE